MARPFDEQTSFTSTSLAATRAWESSTENPSYPASIRYDDADQAPGLGAAVKSSKKSTGLRLKTSTSYGALAAARAAPSHGRLHKRNRSASETASPIAPTLGSQLSFENALVDPTAPPRIHTESYATSASKNTSKAKVKIKPLLRKMSSQNQNAVNLSRSAAENEGLGIYTSSDLGDSRTTSSDAGFVGGRGYHQRAISGASHVSTNTTSQYVHPLKQTPRPYTPPLPGSFSNSLDSSSTGGVPVTGRDLHHFESNAQHDSVSSPYAPLPSPRRTRPPLHIRTTSAPRFTSSSQTNLPDTPSSLRQQTENSQVSASMTPSGRTSFESAFRKRSRANTLDNPEIKAARIAQARHEFRLREDMKDRKLEERKEKEARKQQRRDESRARKRAQSNAASEKSTLRGFGAQGEPVYNASVAGGSFTRPEVRPRTTATGAGKKARNQWILFWIWFRTLLLKLKRKTGKS